MPRHTDLTVSNRRRLRQRALTPFALAAFMLGTSVAAEQTDAQRLSRLEQQVRALSERIGLLESAQSTGKSETADSGGTRWRFKPPLTGQPFAISQKHLDLDAGAADLLLEVTAPVPDRARWLDDDHRAPLSLIATRADGDEETYPVYLVRPGSLELGSFLHVRTEFNPGLAGQIVDILIQGDPGR